MMMMTTVAGVARPHAHLWPRGAPPLPLLLRPAQEISRSPPADRARSPDPCLAGFILKVFEDFSQVTKDFGDYHIIQPFEICRITRKKNMEKRLPKLLGNFQLIGDYPKL